MNFDFHWEVNNILYHLSIDKNLKKLTPRVPECVVSMYEDTVTKRVCFSDWIAGCLSSLQDIPRKYFVYVPDEELDSNELYYPCVKDVRDSKYTHEVWVLKEVKVKCIGIIQSFDCDWTKRHNTGNGRTTLFHYPYKWLEKVS